MSLAPGVRLGAYEILSLLGAGGMGEVYRARDPRLGREVAIKILPTAFSADPDRLRRLEQEARAAAALNHPNIVTIYSIEEASGLLFLTMELVEGQLLADLIPAGGFALKRFFKLAVPLADALSAAHDRDITHRDLKPENIMVTGDGRVKVLDFGLAKLRKKFSDAAATPSSMETTTQDGYLLGTLRYMSPEQLQSKAADNRSDIFSLGLILYQICTGRHPFRGETQAELISSVLRDAPRPVANLRPDLPRHLGRIIRRCLEKDPGRRYQATVDLRNELEDLQAEAAAGQIFEASTSNAPEPGRGQETLPDDSVARIRELPSLLDRQQQVDAAGELVANYLYHGGEPRSMMATLGKALLREDRDFHTIQAVEAAFRQCETTHSQPAAIHVLVAAARYLAAHSPTLRAQGQTYQIAHRLHRGERLYEQA